MPRACNGAAWPSISSRQLRSCLRMNAVAALAADARSPALSEPSSPRMRSSRSRSFWRMWTLLLALQELRHALERRFNRRAVAGIGEPHKAMAVDAVEVDAWGRRDAGLLQHLLAEAQRVIGEAAGIGISVKRAI